MALDLLDLTLLLGITVYLTLCWHGLELFRKHFLAGCVLRLLSIACVQITLGMSWFGHCRKTDVALLILSCGGDWRYFPLRSAWRLLSVFLFFYKHLLALGPLACSVDCAVVVACGARDVQGSVWASPRMCGRYLAGAVVLKVWLLWVPCFCAVVASEPC